MDSDSYLDTTELSLDPGLKNSQVTASDELQLAERVCRYLKTQKTDTKTFLLAYLRSVNASIIKRRKQWGSVKQGWNTTEQVLDEIENVVNQKFECRAKWNEWVLKKAKSIVAQQSPPKSSLYININKLDTTFFSHEKTDEREKVAVKTTDFLYQLITFKLEHGHLAEQKHWPTKQSGDYPDSDSSDSDADPESPTNNSAQNYEFRKSNDKVERAKQRLSAIALTVIQMLNFGCNRRCNGLQVENTITLLACGVSERVNQYMHYIGLSASRKSALRGLLVLSKEKAMTIKQKIKSAGIFGFLLCIDNLDMMERVHSRKVDATSKTYHGTWGYVHYLDSDTLLSLDQYEFTVPAFQRTLKDDLENPVDSGDFIPDVDEHKRWGLTLKNQVARVLLTYMKEPAKYKALPVLNLAAIDQIKAEKPNIDMLKLMDSSDNGSDGIASLYEELIKQTGLTPEAFSDQLQIIEGDLGTCLNFHGLERQRIPSKSPDEALSHLIMVPGAGHTLWNIAQAILLHHWGDPDDKDDLGAWRSAVALGADKAKPTAKKDFTSMIRLIEQIHEATITLCILEVLGLAVGTVQEPIEMSVETFDSTVENVYAPYFSGQALRKARLQEDSKLQQFLLRIRDFATVVEANWAMSDGDIGRLILMWKRWSVMAQGLKGLTHYSRYLPRLIRLLTKVLPKPLAQLIMHSLLISPTGRPGHFVAKDFFLEVQNYWLKYFYNNAGPGTDIQRLKETFSLTIGLLAYLVEQMKGRAGQNQVRQSRKNKITVASMMQFLNMAKIEHINKSKPNSSISKGPIPDVNLLGIHKLQDDYVKRHLERFHWPLSSNYAQPEVTEAEANQEAEQREEFGDADEELVRWVTDELY